MRKIRILTFCFLTFSLVDKGCMATGFEYQDDALEFYYYNRQAVYAPPPHLSPSSESSNFLDEDIISDLLKELNLRTVLFPIERIVEFKNLHEIKIDDIFDPILARNYQSFQNAFEMNKDLVEHECSIIINCPEKHDLFSLLLQYSSPNRVASIHPFQTLLVSGAPFPVRNFLDRDDRFLAIYAWLGSRLVTSPEADRWRESIKESFLSEILNVSHQEYRDFLENVGIGYR